MNIFMSCPANLSQVMTAIMINISFLFGTDATSPLLYCEQPFYIVIIIIACHYNLCYYLKVNAQWWKRDGDTPVL
jgi:hypothetical protein